MVQSLSSTGAWQPIGSFDPRLEFDEVVFDSCSGRARLVFGQRTQIRNVGHVVAAAVGSQQSATALEFLAANHSRLGAVGSEVATAGGGSTQLAERDTLVLRWSAPAVGAGKTRSFFVASRSTTTTTPQAGTLARPAAIEESQAWAFSLDAPRPNPTLGLATIAYTLPTALHLRIRVYDVAGRLVRTLIDSATPAGPGEAVWDGRDEAGRHVSPGVFFYRMEAGGWQSRRKMILASAP